MANIKQIAVIGAGTMGSAIAQHFLMKGLSVKLLDQDRACMNRGCAEICASMDEARSRGIISTEQAAQTVQAEALRLQFAQPHSEDKRHHGEEPEQGAEKGNLEAVEGLAKMFGDGRHDGKADRRTEHPNGTLDIAGKAQGAGARWAFCCHHGI